MRTASNSIVDKESFKQMLKDEINENQKLIEENSQNIKLRLQALQTLTYAVIATGVVNIIVSLLF